MRKRCKSSQSKSEADVKKISGVVGKGLAVLREGVAL
jgi:hypothetical protein